MVSESKKSIIVVGTGGVGKTTVSAMLGLHFAKKRLKTLVITVDPAQRLRDIVGNSQKLHDNLFFYLPDLKSSWYNFLQTVVKNSTKRKEILNNPFYDYLAFGLPGSLEIICAHILYEIKKTNKYDMIILDTPPAAQSLAFFDVPQKIRRVLEQPFTKKMFGHKKNIFSSASKSLALISIILIKNSIEKLIGSHFLSKLIEFSMSLDDLYDPLLLRIKHMENLFCNDQSRFFLVLTANTKALDDYALLKTQLKSRDIAIDELIVNQMQDPQFLPGISKEIQEIADQKNNSKNIKLLNNFYTVLKDSICLEQEILKKLINSHYKTKTKIIFRNNSTGENLLKSMLGDYEECES